MSLLEQLRREKTIGAIGVSCDDLEVATAAVSQPLVDVLQYDLIDSPRCRELLEAAASNGKVSMVRGLARSAARLDGDYEANLAAGFRAALSLPSVGGVIMGTVDPQHLRANVAAFGRATNRPEE